MQRRYTIATIILCTLFLVFSMTVVARGGGVQLSSGDSLQSSLLQSHETALQNDGTVCYRAVQNDVSPAADDADTTVTRYVLNFDSQTAAFYYEQDYDRHVSPTATGSSITEQNLDTGATTTVGSFTQTQTVAHVLFAHTGVQNATLQHAGITIYNDRLVSVYEGARTTPNGTINYQLYVDAHGRIHYLYINENFPDQSETITIYTACGDTTVEPPRTTNTP